MCGNPPEINVGYSYNSSKMLITSLDPIIEAVANHIEASPARAVILHLPTFASATIHPHVNWLGELCPRQSSQVRTFC